MGTPVYFEIIGISLFSVFRLYECNILDGYEFPVYSTDFCPRSQLYWNKRSSAINCTKDNGYLCLPNENITELVEFCLPYPFTIMEEDHCYYLSKRSSIVDSLRCRHFIKGCPSSSFPSFEMFHYPSCTSILNGCFRDAPDCKSSTTNPPDYSWPNKLENSNFKGKEDSTTTFIQETTKHIQRATATKNKIDWVFIVSLFGAFISICVAVCLLIVFLKKRKYLNCKRHEDIESDEKRSFLANKAGRSCVKKSPQKESLTTKRMDKVFQPADALTEKKESTEAESDVDAITEKKENTEAKSDVLDDIIDQVDWNLGIPTNSIMNEEDNWKIYVSTIEELKNADVALMVFGETGNFAKVRLEASPGNPIFQQNNEDRFRANLTFGKFYKIRLELVPKSEEKKPSWKVNVVKLTNVRTKENLVFRFDRWLSREHEDMEIMRELPAIWPGEETPPVFKYYVLVHTGNVDEAETNADVYLNIFGEKGDTGKRMLLQSNNTNKFKCGQVDIFKIEAVSLGKLEKCIVGYNGTESHQGWYLDKIIIRESEDFKKEYTFPCEKWLDVQKEEGFNEQTLFVEDEWKICVSTIEELKNADVALIVYGETGNFAKVRLEASSGKPIFQQNNEDIFRANFHVGKFYKIRLELVPKSEEKKPSWKVNVVKLTNEKTEENLVFRFDRWLSRVHEDMEIMRELPAIWPEGETPPVFKYYVLVHTGDLCGAETNADVYLNIFGEKGDTGKRLLLQSNNTNKFRCGQVDIFKIEAVSLGNLEKCIVGHNGTENIQGWYLDKIIIRESKEFKEEYTFPCEKWLDVQKDEGRNEQTLTVDTSDEPMSQHFVDCQTCGKYSDFYCNSCHKRMCIKCRDNHLSNTDSTKHEVCKYENRKVRLKTVLCKFHPKQELILRCEECNQTICGLCPSTALHFGHKFLNLEEVFTNSRNDSLKEIREIRDSVLPHYQTCLETIRKKKRELENNKDKHANEIQNLEIEEEAFNLRLNELKNYMGFLQARLSSISSGNPLYQLSEKKKSCSSTT